MLIAVVTLGALIAFTGAAPAVAPLRLLRSIAIPAAGQAPLAVSPDGHLLVDDTPAGLRVLDAATFSEVAKLGMVNSAAA